MDAIPSIPSFNEYDIRDIPIAIIQDKTIFYTPETLVKALENEPGDDLYIKRARIVEQIILNSGMSRFCLLNKLLLEIDILMFVSQIELGEGIELDDGIERFITQHSPFKYISMFRKGTTLLECLYINSFEESKSIQTKYSSKSTIPSASLLRESLVSFKPIEGFLTSISFNSNNEIELPVITLYHKRTEIILRNLLAYEMSRMPRERPVQQYLFFMNCLIDNENDVQILIDQGIIVNKMGTNFEAVELFNTMRGFSSNISNKLKRDMDRINIRYKNKFYTFLGTTYHLYFDTYFKTSIFIVTFVISVSAIIQTIYTILPFYTGK